MRGLIEFSNVCSRNCCYCGLRRDNRQIRRYRMSPEEIVDVSVKVLQKGIGTVVLQSGEDPWYTAEIMADIIRRIKSKASNAAITLCIGERTYDEYRIMREAGADRYLLRHETANPDLYRELHPDMSFQNRIRCLRDLKSLGYQVGAGSMVGLPSQTVEDMARDVVFLRELDVDMVGIGPFIPHPNTPLGNEQGGSLEMTLKMVAAVRIATRNTLIPATTAIGSIDPDGREKALMAGANVVMPNFTPLQYRVNYEIYPNKRCITEDPGLCYNCIQKRITSIGRTIGKGPGHSLRWRFYRKINGRFVIEYLQVDISLFHTQKLL
ncbi:MAG: [FeFe] hydrogenase H-cluster radical SAM maturase HydE [Armatimonadetes bacterium]|nr:[FeFe] hydrogenase H-cluster radical SAM maturase HydE [Armatimonadota bacterium]